MSRMQKFLNRHAIISNTSFLNPFPYNLKNTNLLKSLNNMVSDFLQSDNWWNVRTIAISYSVLNYFTDVYRETTL